MTRRRCDVAVCCSIRHALGSHLVPGVDGGRTRRHDALVRLRLHHVVGVCTHVRPLRAAAQSGRHRALHGAWLPVLSGRLQAAMIARRSDVTAMTSLMPLLLIHPPECFVVCILVTHVFCTTTAWQRIGCVMSQCQQFHCSLHFYTACV